MKDCKKIHPLLPFYIEEKLSPTERKLVEKHLDACDAARAELRHFQLLMEGLRKMPEPPIPHDLHAKIMARLGAPPQAAPPHRFLFSPQAWALAAAAVLVVVLVNQFPEWKDNLRVQPAKEQAEITNSPNKTAPPAPPAPFLRSVSESAGKPTAKRKELTATYKLTNTASNADANRVSLYAGLPPKEKDEEKQFGVAGPAAKVAEAPATAAGGVNNYAEPQRLKKANEAPNGTNLTLAAAPPAAPKPEAMDQSLQSLTYTREQSVTVWNGNGGPATVEQQELVTDADSFQKYWEVAHPGETPPLVDFTTQAVVVLMAGEKPTAGYSIHVTRLEEKADQVVVHYKLESPGPGAVTAQIITHPWAIQIIPKPSKPATFVQDSQ